MHPPAWICEALHRVNPQLRLGWAGKEKAHEDELNPGSFALVQLYHVSDVQDLDDPSTFRLTWDHEPYQTDDGVTRLKRVDRGPVFNKAGGLRRDWDSAFRVPIFVATLDEEYGFTIDDVVSGRFLETVRRWLTPIEDRIRASAREKGQELASRTSDVAGEIADAAWFEAKKHDSETVIMANKHCKDDMAAFESGKERAHGQLESYYEPPPMDV